MFANYKDPVLFVGTYTEHKGSQSKGIYAYQLDSASGNLSFKANIEGVRNPSFLVLHPQKNFLYAVNEVERFAPEEGGGVSAFAVEPASGTLTLVNARPSYGKDPCYICIEQTGRFALVANYGSGSIAMFPILPSGELGAASDVVQHSGSSINPDRQAGPHVHCIRPDPENRYAISTDLGADKLVIYRMDLENGKLNAHEEVRVQPGTGPRHLIFHPNGQYMYLINELNSTLIVYRYYAGNLEELQTISALPETYAGKNLSAALHISGKYLYASNRGHDSIVWYLIDENTGRLSYQGWVPSGGKEPRSFVIDASGMFLVAAHEKSNNIVVFKIDAVTGALNNAGYDVKLSQPVCVRFGH